MSCPPEPMMHPNAEWCEAYERWHHRYGPAGYLRLENEVDRLRNELDAERARVDRLAKGADALIHANAVLRRAVEPFAWIGQWMFARPDIPDSEPVTEVLTLNDSFDLTREHFKRCHAAVEIANDGEIAHERYRAMFKPAKEGDNAMDQSPRDAGRPGQPVAVDEIPDRPVDVGQGPALGNRSAGPQLRR